MATFEYVSLKCASPWCGATFIRPRLTRKSTQACVRCGRTAKVASEKEIPPQPAPTAAKRPAPINTLSLLAAVARDPRVPNAQPARSATARR